MTNRKTKIGLAAIACLLAASSVAAECTLCHGTGTNGNIGIFAPKLSGQSREYLQDQLNAFRNGERGTHPKDISGNEMRKVAIALAPNEMKMAIDLVMVQRPIAPTATVQGNAARGRELYAPCAACHGDRGEGSVQLRAPRLAQGSDWYWVIQLKNYRGGLRGDEKAGSLAQAMKAAAAQLPDDQAVNDVVAYINTLN